jgi:hypothetical protein
VRSLLAPITRHGPQKRTEPVYRQVEVRILSEIWTPGFLIGVLISRVISSLGFVPIDVFSSLLCMYRYRYDLSLSSVLI